MNTIIADEIQKKEDAHVFEAVRRALEDIDPIDRQAVQALYDLAERQQAKAQQMAAAYDTAMKLTRQRRDERIAKLEQQLNEARQFVGAISDVIDEYGDEVAQLLNAHMSAYISAHWRAKGRDIGLQAKP